MTAHAVPRPRPRHRFRSLALPLTLLVGFVACAAGFIGYVLRPSWPTGAVVLDAPSIPVTVGGVLFNVPPAAIRRSVQRHPGEHERIDLAFVWPSLAPPPADAKASAAPLRTDAAEMLPPPPAADRVFVTIAGLGDVLPAVERLRTIYPRYFESEATAGPDGLGILPFRAATPYEGEDLIYLVENPEQFFARCTRVVGAVPGTCLAERSLDSAAITLRFSRDWLENWRSIAAGFERLITQLHPSKQDAH